MLKGPTQGYSDVFLNRQNWSEIAHDLNGELKIQLSSGNVLESHLLSIPFKDWEIVLSHSDSRPLKLSIAFESCVDFELLLSRKDFLDKILQKLGKHAISAGSDSFDKQFLISSNKPDWVNAVLTKDIQKLLLEYNLFSISYQTDFKNRKSELTGLIQGNAGNKEMIVGIINLFKALANQLKQQNIIE